MTTAPFDPTSADDKYIPPTTIISVDDHLVEPPTMFEGRLPKGLQDRAPRVIEARELGTAGNLVQGTPGTRAASHDTGQVWVYEGRIFEQVGLNAVAGRQKSEYARAGAEPINFAEMRPGCYDIQARIEDMNIGGMWASVNFPSHIAGFCGSVFSQSRDPDLGFATMQAWNDWLYEEWWQPYPKRIIPLGITWLADLEKGAAEIRRNAERGFTAVSLPEMPHLRGFASIFSDEWDPIFKACVDTDTAICLHVGSTGYPFDPAPGAPLYTMRSALFPVLSLLSSLEWSHAGIVDRYPDIKIVMSEGGIGFVPMLLDRLDFMESHSGSAWLDLRRGKTPPAEAVRRNFYFCTLDDPSTFRCRDVIGVDRIMFEVDYPHGDSTWPDTQQLVKERFAGVPEDEVRMMTYANAARIFRHPLPSPADIEQLNVA